MQVHKYLRTLPETMAMFCVLIFQFTGMETDAQGLNRDSLLKRITIETNATSRIDLLNTLAYEYRRGDKDSGNLFTDSAFKMAKPLNYHKGIAWYYKNKSVFLFYENPDSALVLNELAHKHFTLARDLYGALAILQHRTNIYYMQGDYDLTLTHAFTTLKQYEQLPDTSMEKQNKQAELYHTIGLLYWNKSRYDSALYYTQQEERLAHATGNKNLLQLSYSTYSQIYAQYEEYDKAIKYVNEAIPILRSLGDRPGLVLSYSNLAWYYIEMKEPDSAARYADTTLYYANAFEVYRHHAGVWNTRGLIAAMHGQYRQAVDCYREGISWADKTGNTYMKATCKTSMAYAYVELKQYAEAMEAVKAAKVFYDENDDLESLEICFNIMARAYSGLGKFEKAYKAMVQKAMYHDSVFNMEKHMITNRLSFEYETEKKQQQISELKRESDHQSQQAAIEKQKKRMATAGAMVLLLLGGIFYYMYRQRTKLNQRLLQSLNELKQTQQQLIKLEKEKEAEAIRLRISRDIHDDIGSSLTKIAMLGSLTSTQVKDKLPEVSDQLGKISDYARSVNNSMSEIIWAVNPKQDSLENLLGYMRVHTQEFLKDSNIQFKINFPDSVPPLQLNPDLKRSLFLVLKESLNNTLKHAGAKNIHITFAIEPLNTFTFTIADDGAGFALQTSMQSKSGNGLFNLQQRVEQAGCSFNITTAPGSGCTVLVKGRL